MHGNLGAIFHENRGFSFRGWVLGGLSENALLKGGMGERVITRPQPIYRLPLPSLHLNRNLFPDNLSGMQHNNLHEEYQEALILKQAYGF